MPHQSPSPDVSFQRSVHSDSPQKTEYKTVHIVVVKPITKDNQDSIGFLFFPLVLVFLIALTILFILSKVKPGATTNRILNILEKRSSAMWLF
jgi:hypothetical protein